MNNEQIRQTAKKYADTEYTQMICVKIIKEVLTHGWNKVDVVPIGYEPLLVIYLNCVSNPVCANAEWAGYFYDPADEREIKNILYWRYDNANELLELLNEQTNG